MSVLLVGVGADEEHLRPAPELDSMGRYEYIPIPETWLTSESRTYGSLELEHQDSKASEVIDRIRPKGEDGDWITDEKRIREHPIHYDPDFEAATFGDSRGTGVGTTLDDNLQAGDILGFYTGMRGENGHLNRYIYGYFEVNRVDDLSQYEESEYRDKLREHPENAHAKRLEQVGKPKHDDLVIVDGKDPSRVLDGPVKISERIDSPPYYQLTEEFVSEYSVQNGQIAVSRKPGLILDLDNDEFITKLTE